MDNGDPFEAHIFDISNNDGFEAACDFDISHSIVVAHYQVKAPSPSYQVLLQVANPLVVSQVQ